MSHSAISLTTTTSRLCQTSVSQLDTCFVEHHRHGPSGLQVVVTRAVISTRSWWRRWFCCYCCWRGCHTRPGRQSNRLANHAVDAMFQSSSACRTKNTAPEKNTHNSHTKTNIETSNSI